MISAAGSDLPITVNFCLMNFVNYSVASLLRPLVSFNGSSSHFQVAALHLSLL